LKELELARRLLDEQIERTIAVDIDELRSGMLETA